MTQITCESCGSPPEECECWKFPGWGKVHAISITEVETDTETRVAEGPHSAKLGEWRATGICGNDITSSCLYVSALAALYAGPLAPLALLLVAGVLFLFRKIYSEIGSALPLNGGAYTLLLNTTTKWRAALAACLTLLSYIATAVISGSEAMHYAVDFVPSLNILWATIVLLGLFAVLNILGISDSANVALAIFVLHLLTLVMLVLLAGAALIQDPSTLLTNWQTPIADWPVRRPGSLLVLLFFGFSAAMLGISGFESSANYIEEQQPGVFPKTLRNMWIAVAIFNPLISLLSFAVFPMAEIGENKEALLSQMGHHSLVRITGLDANAWLPRLISQWISFDAVVVLSGAVLTSYVGVTGLMRRMSLDSCLPQFLLSTNRWRGTNHWIIGAFFALCCSILLITHGEIEMLAGVYTLSFLSVMGLFATGNLLLKRKHPNLPRTSRAGGLAVRVAVGAVALALVGNVVLDPDYVRVFLMYFVSAALVVGFVFYRTVLFRFMLKGLSRVFTAPGLSRFNVRKRLVAQLHELECHALLFAVTELDPHEIRPAVEYVRRNEQRRLLKIVWFHEAGQPEPAELEQVHRELDQSFPDVRIDFMIVDRPLSPAAVDMLSIRLDVPNNYIFVSSKTATSVGSLADFGGARIIV